MKQKQIDRIVAAVTPNEKHLKILKDACKAPNEVIKFGDTIRLNVALAAMQILQNEIDELRKENELLNKRVLIWSTMALDKEVKATEHKLRELKKPKNPE